VIKRLLPTGQCWCGCSARIDLGSFFAPGHDKRAESRVIMEVFGDVPHFVNAFGYGPDAEGNPGTASWVDNAMRLAALPTTTKFQLEYPNISDRAGPLLRHDTTLGGQIDLSDGSVTFNVVRNARATNSIVVPFVDVSALYKEVGTWVVRTTGILLPTAAEPAGARYVPLNHGTRIA
jgi:hypothetical protein